MFIAANSLIYFVLFISLFFEVFLLITYIENRAKIKKEGAGEIKLNKYPSVTIIVPCFNEEKTITKTVFSLLDLDYPKDKLKIIVVDDGSKDDSFKVIKKLEKYNQVKVFHKENGGKHTAVNFALDKIKTDLVGCLDADSFVDKDTLKRIALSFENPQIMAVTPSIKVYKPQNIIQKIQRVEYNWGIFLRKMLSFLDALYVTPGPFSIFRRKVFDDLGYYKKAYNTEDLEMALRMQSKHYKIGNSYKAFVYTVTPNTVRALYKQRLRWTYGFMKNVIDYKHLLLKKEYGNLGFFILPVATLSIFSALYFAGTFLISVISNLINYIIKVETIGINWGFDNLFKFDWFYMKTGSAFLLSLVLFVISVSLVILSRKLAEGKIKILSMELAYFLVIYPMIVPLWLAKSVFNTIFSISTTWR